jgi:hypothetical protein
MSSTNRGKDRNLFDYYITPQPAIHTFLDAWSEDINWQKHISGYVILDPCAGGDEQHEMSYPAVLQKYNLINPIMTVDYRQDSKAMYKEDFLKFKTPANVYLIIANPPFYNALKFIQHSLTISKLYVVSLLRLNFFGSQARAGWFKDHMPILTYVHSKRLNFTGNGTDSIEYMHCVWQVGNYPKFTQLRVI